MATESGRGVHHVVWCVKPESWSSVRAFWEETMGVPLDELDLPDLGLKVLVSWHGGVEIMTPAYESGMMAAAARQFIAERGEGVYAVVYDVRDIDDVISSFTARGGQLLFRKPITADEVEERKLSSGERFSILHASFGDFFGMRILLQETVPESRG